MVPKAGLEPARDEALVSKTSMSTNSITWAVYFNFDFDLQNQKNGGQRGIRTPEVVDKGFTVLPI